MQRAEAGDRSLDLTIGDTKSADRIDMEAQILQVDHKRGVVEARLVFEPQGALVSKDGFLLAKDLTLLVNSETGGQDRKFEKGKPMSPQDVTLRMYNGEFADYPFDAFEAILQVIVTSGSSKDGDLEVEPVSLALTANVPGLKIGVGEETGQAPGAAAVHLNISRSPLSLAVAWGVILLYWLMTLAVVGVTYSIAVRGKELAPDLLAYVAGLLFAFVAFRTTMPGDPPVGALADFLAFFWAEAIVAISLVVLVITFIRRPSAA